MALILAIEPDRRQASHLTAIVRGRLRAELVLGDTAQRALAALGDRVPDLVLTTRLRALDGAAAHVQTLTIPVLASPAKRSSRTGGMLSALLRETSDDEPTDGCDPAFFAEQCKKYLERAVTEKAESQRAAHDDEPIVITPAVIPESTAAEPTEFEPVAEMTEFAEAAPVEPVERVEPIVETTEPVSAARAAFSIRDFYTHRDADDAPSSLMAAVAALSEDEPTVEAAEPSAVATPPAFAAETREEASTDVDLSAMLEDQSRARPASNDLASEGEAIEVYELDDNTVFADTQDEPPATVSEVQLYTPLAHPEVRTWPILEGLVTGTNGKDTPVSEAADSTVPERREPDDHELVEWSDIIEALRRDAQPVALEREPPARVQTETIQLPNVLIDTPFWPESLATTQAVAPEPVAPAPAPADPPAVEPDPAESSNGSRKRGRKASVEDEWGFFDPDRAGFAALLAKLEEITEDDSTKTQRT
jgi:hypothetical protein